MTQVHYIKGKPSSVLPDIPTADLIAELKYRSPNCEKCEHIHESIKSDNCFYCYWGVLSLKKDNFKETK